MKELVASELGEAYSDDPYKISQGNDSVFINDFLDFSLLLGVVRCLELISDQAEQMYNEWLHELFLAKRRVAVVNLKPETSEWLTPSRFLLLFIVCQLSSDFNIEISYLIKDIRRQPVGLIKQETKETHCFVNIAQ
jgi:hypothetical protein